MIRPAHLDDIDALLVIENECFNTDRLSRRNFRYLLSKAHAHTIVEEEQGVIRGYTMLLLSRGTSMARLYSLAIRPAYQQRGIAKTLFATAEEIALAHDCVSLRLETRGDNIIMQGLVKKNGYKYFDEVSDYYEDHMRALRFEKFLAPHIAREMVSVPFYQQTLEFTCGPSALMMAMRALDNSLELNRRLELRIWREATTIFMTSGHGGCGPYGLALSAHHRGYDVEIYVSDKAATDAMFIDSVRNPEKKSVMRLVEADFLDEISRLPINLVYGNLNVAGIKAKFDVGAIPLVLISSYRIYREKFPHWVVITGFDDKYIYAHDPLVDDAADESIMDSINMPILRKDFERMARYGKSAQKAVLFLRKKTA
ncbi:GNAT family N-acetyltransferase/peptidase C39 family protein [Beggiatoa leptomitoformis]|uniref:GNAT family N-acetyltransferase n=1 Tax=Beggiatoa leptomitoformis TaxID=288004 RepID=A0A2N9YBZ2_9GAMM|nr:GNAT family N-acetyltransferase/peptidase C39 family protein [Beggiatoa leptomitoformis]ALG66681.1 GNAT family N-acetyltransferase [Beggiatoa leptomitoformis]AUI67993.1 GNAT family N-acetyltransferase [Beggiatoa leptomitoformis]